MKEGEKPGRYYDTGFPIERLLTSRGLDPVRRKPSDIWFLPFRIVAGQQDVQQLEGHDDHILADLHRPVRHRVPLLCPLGLFGDRLVRSGGLGSPLFPTFLVFSGKDQVADPRAG